MSITVSKGISAIWDQWNDYFIPDASMVYIRPGFSFCNVSLSGEGPFGLAFLEMDRRVQRANAAR